MRAAKNLLIPITTISALALLACGYTGRPDYGGEGTDSGIDPGLDGGADGTGAGAPGGPGNPLKLDAPPDESGMVDAGDVSHWGCEQVDLLFVIDNSGSMDDKQVNLVNSVPSFISEIQTQLADADSYHVGVITSDEYEYNDGCDDEGAMVITTGGSDSSDAVCGPYAEGYSYMTEFDDLDIAFPCAAKVGTDGDGDERPMQTMQAALSPEMNEPGGCNEGFLRDDALLVIVIITDEEDDHEAEGCSENSYPGSSGDPPDWFEEVVEAKGGVEQNVVVLALVGPPGPDPATCPAIDKCDSDFDGAEVAERIVSFTTMFTNGFVGRVCEPSYGEFFSEAVGVISTACENFEPIG
ncbi:hypothetical protein ENSA5_65330 [Enhygromyxa salina]|uniref:VWFA domain-containing protein n=1 Tax=Enhygromyxa salina TaxID=215803 RepID=A0A2S9XBW2_9BACT|nr:hypothetical protein [Enhygromyxa salina]PRP90336.1 hypothetical protein ENSA5_65330 [Enhygromyxa salina]